MKVINIADEKKRNSKVALEHKSAQRTLSYVDENKSPVSSVRVVKNTLETDLASLVEGEAFDELSQKLVDGDPEIDFELFGKRVDGTTRIFLNDNNQPAGAVTVKELFYNGKGELLEEKPLAVSEPNINLDAPLSWTGKYHPKSKSYNKYVFANSFQIRHVDGLTFDFLFNMAKTLDEKDALLLLGGGEKSNKPLVFMRNGKPYRGFLEGRVKDNSYKLILHISNLELKPLPVEEEPADA